MFCFRDMTFCTYYKECKDGEGCHRALNDDIDKAAKAWWKEVDSKDNPNNVPIAIFADKPECFIELEEG